MGSTPHIDRSLIYYQFMRHLVGPFTVCIISESGNMFLRALPDFIKWEKHRSGPLHLFVPYSHTYNTTRAALHIRQIAFNVAIIVYSNFSSGAAGRCPLTGKGIDEGKHMGVCMIISACRYL